MPSDIEKALLELIAAEILRTQANRFNPSARDVAFMAKWTCDVFNAKVALESAASAVAEYTCNVADKKAELAAAVERADSPETRETAFYSEAKFAEQLAKSYATRLEDYRAKVSADDEETWEAAVAAAIKARKARDVENLAYWRVRNPGKPDPTVWEARRAAEEAARAEYDADWRVRSAAWAKEREAEYADWKAASEAWQAAYDEWEAEIASL